MTNTSQTAPRAYNCKECGTLLRVVKDEITLELLDALGEGWLIDLCVTCRFHADLNRRLANRSLLPHAPFGSPPEEALWNALLKEFEREEVHIFNQVSTIFSYCLDFYFPQFRLAVEVDSHAFHEKAHDERRDAEHNKYGIVTARFWADEVSLEMSSVLSRIRKFLNRRRRFVFLPESLASSGGEGLTTRLGDFL